MAAPSHDDLKREVEAVFGTVLTDDEIESGKGRLPTMVDNARLLADWGGQARHDLGPVPGASGRRSILPERPTRDD